MHDRQPNLGIWNIPCENRGYTLIELMVTVTLIGIITGAIVPVLTNHQRLHKRSELLTEAQQNAYTALDILVKDIRCAGYGIDHKSKQLPIAYAGPWDICINANLEPYPDTLPPGFAPQAIDISKNKPNVYSPGKTYHTGAETIRYGLDYNNDGQISVADQSASPSHTIDATPNPNDFLLTKQVYGYNPSTCDNGGENQPVSIIRGPLGGTVKPLFMYWLDDGSIKGTLWGDTDGDKELSDEEIANLQPVPQDKLEKIIRVTVMVTGEASDREAKYKENGGYHQVVLTSEAEVTRNRPPWIGSEPQEIIDGYVYWDKNENGIKDADEPGRDLVRLHINTDPGALKTVTDYSGYYRFFLPPDNYTLHLEVPLGWEATTENPVDLNPAPKITINFGLRPLWPLGFISGIVFKDDNVNQIQDPGEAGIGKVGVSLAGGYERLTSDYDGSYIFEVFEGSYIVSAEPLMNYVSTTPESALIDVTPPDTVQVNFGHVYVRDDSIAPEVTVMIPDDGEVWTVGDTNNIEWIATDDIIVKSIDIQYSTNGGLDWIPVAAGEENDSIYSWIIPNTPSNICKVKVIATDGAQNKGEDMSNFYFTIESP